MEFIAHFKAELKAEILAELRAELVQPVVEDATKFDSWNKLFADKESYKIFCAWYIENEKKFNHIRHAFNWILKHEQFLRIVDGKLITASRTWSL